jgi:hypothetical protein
MIDVGDIKIAVLQVAFGIKALEDKELFEKLEQFWISAYKQGCADTGEAVLQRAKQIGARLSTPDTSGVTSE